MDAGTDPYLCRSWIQAFFIDQAQERMARDLLHRTGPAGMDGRDETGGYRLKKPVSAYTVGGILRAAEGNFTPVSCSGLLTPSSCSRAPSCPTFPLWKELERRVDEYLESVTLADLLEGNVKKI